MNIEQNPKIPDRVATNEQLIRRLDRFANILAHGRWLENSVQMVESTQCYIERLGDECTTGDDEVEPIFNEVTLSFSATKQTQEEDGRLYSLPSYTVTSTVAQDIDKNDIPSYVLDEIFDDAQDENSPGHDVLSEAGFDDLLEREAWHDMTSSDSDNLDQFQIKREQEVEYTILYDGTVEDYAIDYVYSFDDTPMHRVTYRQSDGQFFTQPVRYSREDITDNQPAYVTQLTQGDIEQYLAGLDSRVEAFFAEQAIRTLEVVAQLPEKEHIRRIMGMVAMASSGYAPRRWYTRVIDTSRVRLQQYHQRRREQGRSVIPGV